MKKRIFEILLLMLCIVMTVGLLSSCGSCKSNKDTHHYSTEWSSNDEKHWHACIDEGYTDLKADEADNEYDNGEVIKEATDYESGEIKYTCTICGHEKLEIIPQKATVYYSVDNTTLLLRNDNTFTMVCDYYIEDDGSNMKTFEKLGIIEKSNNSCLLIEKEIYLYERDYGIQGAKRKYDFDRSEYIDSLTTYSLINLSANVIAVADLNYLPYCDIHIYTNKLDSNKDFLANVKPTDFGTAYDCILEKDRFIGNIYKVNKNGSFDYIHLSYNDGYEITKNNINTEVSGIYDEKLTYGEMFKDYAIKIQVPGDDDEDDEMEIRGMREFEVNNVPDKDTVIKDLFIHMNMSGDNIYLNDPAVQILQYPEKITQKGDYPVKISYNNKEIDFSLIIYDKNDVYDVEIHCECENYLVPKGTSVEDAFTYFAEDLNYGDIEGKEIIINGYDPNKLGGQCVTATCDNIVSDEVFIFVYDDSNKDTILYVEGIYEGNTEDSKRYYGNIIIGETKDNLYLRLYHADKTHDYVKLDTSKIKADINYATNTVSVFGFYDIEQENGFTLHLNVTVGYTNARCLDNYE